MAIIVAGTADARARHRVALSAVGMTLGYTIPALIAILGFALEGPDAIVWGRAILAGLVAAFVMWVVMFLGRMVGITRIDLLDLLGSLVSRPHTSTSHTLGFIIHEIDGALLAIAGAYGALLVGWQFDWASGLLWGVLLWALSLLVMTSVGGVHPAMRRGQEEDPGAAAINMGPMTPWGALMAHAVYGLVLGGLYIV